jgi:hypothetical protein
MSNENRIVMSEFVLLYLKYLRQWNKSASLSSVVESVERRLNILTQEEIDDLVSIAVFEYTDTKEMIDKLRNKDVLMTLEDFYFRAVTLQREEKINTLLDEPTE